MKKTYTYNVSVTIDTEGPSTADLLKQSVKTPLSLKRTILEGLSIRAGLDEDNYERIKLRVSKTS